MTQTQTTTNTPAFQSNLRRTRRALGTKTVRTVTEGEGNKRWGFKISADSSDWIVVRIRPHYQIDGESFFQLFADNGRYFTAREIAKKLKAAIKSIDCTAAPVCEDSEDHGQIVYWTNIWGEDNIYRVIEGDAVEVWEQPEPEIGHFGRWIPATDGWNEAKSDLLQIVTAFHQWTGNVHA